MAHGGWVAEKHRNFARIPLFNKLIDLCVPQLGINWMNIPVSFSDPLGIMAKGV